MQPLHRTLWVVTIALALQGFAACAADDQPDTAFNNAEKGFAIKYPQSWKKVDATGDVGVRFIGPQNVFVEVNTIEMRNGNEFQSYFRTEIKTLQKALKDFKEVENGRAAIAGHDAKKYTHTCTVENLSLKITTYYLTKSKKAGGYRIYKIMCLAPAELFDKNQRTLEAIAETFELKDE